jgi:hypothetical protein
MSQCNDMLQDSELGVQLLMNFTTSWTLLAFLTGWSS